MIVFVISRIDYSNNNQIDDALVVTSGNCINEFVLALNY